MNLKEFKELCIITRNEIISRNNSINVNYKLIEDKLKNLKSKSKVLRKEIISLVLTISLICGSATFIGINTKNERKSKLFEGIYTEQRYKDKRGVDYLTAYFGYVLLLLVIYGGVSYIKGKSVFKNFIINLKKNINEYKCGVVETCYLFSDLKEDITYLLAYLCQFEECKKCYDNILVENPYLSNDDIIDKISIILESLDIENIEKNISVKRKILNEK